MAETRIPTMAHLFSFLVILLWITEGESFAVYPISKGNKLVDDSYPAEVDNSFELNKKELCLLKNCIRFKGLEFASCYLTCTAESLNENEIAEDESHFRRDLKSRQVDPLRSCIEAKCARALAYSDCIYSQCIMGLRLGYKNYQRKSAEPLDVSAVKFPRIRNEKRGTAEKSLQRMRKKSWNDPSDACIAFHCGSKSPGSMVYSICVNTNCGSSYER